MRLPDGIEYHVFKRVERGAAILELLANIDHDLHQILMNEFGDIVLERVSGGGQRQLLVKAAPIVTLIDTYLKVEREKLVAEFNALLSVEAPQ